MKKNRFLLLAGILGFAFMGASCASAAAGGGMARKANEVQVEMVTHKARRSRPPHRQDNGKTKTLALSFSAS